MPQNPYLQTNAAPNPYVARMNLDSENPYLRAEASRQLLQSEEDKYDMSEYPYLRTLIGMTTAPDLKETEETAGRLGLTAESWQQISEEYLTPYDREKAADEGGLKQAVNFAADALKFVPVDMPIFLKSISDAMYEADQGDPRKAVALVSGLATDLNKARHITELPQWKWMQKKLEGMEPVSSFMKAVSWLSDHSLGAPSEELKKEMEAEAKTNLFWSAVGRPAVLAGIFKVAAAKATAPSLKSTKGKLSPEIIRAQDRLKAFDGWTAEEFAERMGSERMSVEEIQGKIDKANAEIRVERVAKQKVADKQARVERGKEKGGQRKEEVEKVAHIEAIAQELFRKTTEEQGRKERAGREHILEDKPHTEMGEFIDDATFQNLKAQAIRNIGGDPEVGVAYMKDFFELAGKEREVHVANMHNAINRHILSMSKKPKAGDVVGAEPTRHGVVETLNSLEMGARERIEARLEGVGKSIDLQMGGLKDIGSLIGNIGDLSVIGAAKMAKGAIKFSKWSKEMLAEFGDGIKPHLQELYRASQSYFERYKDEFVQEIEVSKQVKLQPKGTTDALQKQKEVKGTEGAKEVVKEAVTEVPKEKIAVTPFEKHQEMVERFKTQPAVKTTKTKKVGGEEVEVVEDVQRPSGFRAHESLENWEYRSVRPQGNTEFLEPYIKWCENATMEQRKTAPNQMPPLTEHYLIPKRKLLRTKVDWITENKTRMAAQLEGLSKAKRRLVLDLTGRINRKGAYVKPHEMAESFRDVLGDMPIETATDFVSRAQELRRGLEHIRKEANEAHKLRGQEEIGYIENYTPQQLLEPTLWQLWKHDVWKEADISHSPGLPDFIRPTPNKPFNPHIIKRMWKLDRLERDPAKLLNSYVDRMADDIYNTSIIEMSKSTADVLKDMGHDNIANAIYNDAAVSYGGIRPWLDNWLKNVPRSWEKTAARSRSAFIKSIFPWNWQWSTFIQTLSSAYTFSRFGTKSCVRGMLDWYGNREIRNMIKGTDNARIKRGVSLTREAINQGATSEKSLVKTKLDTVNDWGTFFLRMVEEELNGWSGTAALHHGKRLGLKGEALTDYINDGIARTQSMYNYENMAPVLKSQTARTAMPLQGFAAEGLNIIREMTNKTGVTRSRKTRAAMALRLMAATTVGNWFVNMVQGREPWQATSFVPFGGVTVQPLMNAIKGERLTFSNRGIPAPIMIAADGAYGVYHVGDAIYDFVVNDEDFNFDKMRPLMEWVLGWGTGFINIGGGQQIKKLVDGIITMVKDDGDHLDDDGDFQFYIDPDNRGMLEVFRLFAMGANATGGGQQYSHDRYEGGFPVLPTSKMVEGEVLGQKVEMRYPHAVLDYVPGVGQMITESKGNKRRSRQSRRRRR